MADSTSVLTINNLVKTYGFTRAVADIGFSIMPGEVVGLVGANGAGKSTLTRLISGVHRPDSGEIRVNGRKMGGGYDVVQAAGEGIRVVYQELSLCSNLNVYENIFVEQSQLFTGRHWRRRAREKAAAALNAVFPGCNINPNTPTENLNIAQQQMVEIARANCDENLRLLILDEPTSSLGVHETEQLISYIKQLSGTQTAVIYISHRLGEVMELADRVVLLQNGALKWEGRVEDTDQEDLVRRMSDVGDGTTLPVLPTGRKTSRPAKEVTRSGRISMRRFSTKELNEIEYDFEGGKVVGIAGLEGGGQKELLRAFFSGKKSHKGDMLRDGKIAYVSGDRKKEGVFSLWSILENMQLTKIAADYSLVPINKKEIRSLADKWYDRLNVKANNINMPITSLSGGNQQKILIARAMLAEADIILLDDPTRGVDVATKNQLYDLFREVADEGKLVVWRSTEDDEFARCDEVVVMRYGRILKALKGGEITKDAIIQASFTGENWKPAGTEERKGFRLNLHGLGVPLLVLVAVYLISGYMTPSVFSVFGLELLVGGAFPLVLCAFSQMFIIGLSQINMGAGAYMGLINVLVATAMVNNFFYGWLAILLTMVAFAAMGVLIYVRNIPAIIITLGGSFVWTGLAYTIQQTPGGSCPAWLSAIFNVETPFLPAIIYYTLLVSIVAILIYRSKYGTILKGFGNNPEAMKRSGWSCLKGFVIGYAISAGFAVLGGLTVTAMTTASDANATSTYTMLTIASVVMGGGELGGGKVNPLGVLIGGITLFMIGSLLGFLNVSSNYVAMVQGMLLVVILAARLMQRGKLNELV